jgi:thioredoxin-like negative regulator of GroEL
MAAQMTPQMKAKYIKTMAAAKKLQVCQNKFCKVEKANSDTEAAQIKKKIELLSAKLPYKQLMKELKKIGEESLNSKSTYELAKCGLAHCESELKVNFNNLLEFLKETCDKTKSKVMCKNYNEGKRILKGKMDVDAYKNFIKLMMP